MVEYKYFSPQPKIPRIKNNKLLKDKKGICFICGKIGQTEKHHIKSKGSGGNDTPENLIEICRICHTKIHSGNLKIGDNK
jgi:5-methylcytosine-specific restriction endonuclease McrA